MTLENLLRIGKLKPHKSTHEEVARLLTAMRRNLKDSRNVEISPESRFDIAYKAIMQCALVAMMANGYRPSTNEPGLHPDRWNSYSPRLSNGALQLLEWLGFVAFSQGVCAIEFDSESQMKKQTFESVWDVLEKSPMN